MKQVLLDTNVILRLLLADHEDHYARAINLFNDAAAKKYRLHLNAEILAECIFVLESFYKVSRTEIALLMNRLLEHPGIYTDKADVLKLSLKQYESSRIDIADCLLATRSKIQKCPIATFDNDFKKLKNVELLNF